MKTVIYHKPPEDTILLETLLKAEFPLIGFLTQDNVKGTLFPKNYNSKQYISRVVNNWAKANGFLTGDTKDSRTLEEWITFLRAAHNTNFFVFEDVKEMFKWLSKD